MCAGERLAQHPDDWDDACHGSLEAQLHPARTRRIEQLLAVLGEQLLVGRDDMLAGLQRSEHVFARRLDPADQLDDQVRGLEDLGEIAFAGGERLAQHRQTTGEPLDVLGTLSQQRGEGRADGAEAEQADIERHGGIAKAIGGGHRALGGHR